MFCSLLFSRRIYFCALNKMYHIALFYYNTAYESVE